MLPEPRRRNKDPAVLHFDTNRRNLRPIRTLAVVVNRPIRMFSEIRKSELEMRLHTLAEFNRF